MSKFDVEKFDGIINFGLWQVQVKDVLIQSGLHKALKGKPVSSGESSSTSKNEEEWEDLDLRAASTIRLCLAKNVLANVHGISTAKELWEKLEQLYQGNFILYVWMEVQKFQIILVFLTILFQNWRPSELRWKMKIKH